MYIFPEFVLCLAESVFVARGVYVVKQFLEFADHLRRTVENFRNLFQRTDLFRTCNRKHFHFAVRIGDKEADGVNGKVEMLPVTGPEEVGPQAFPLCRPDR